MKIPFALILFICGLWQMTSAQNPLPETRNGLTLPVHGHLRVLLIFVEIEYPEGKPDIPVDESSQWKSGTYPEWADELFDAFPAASPTGLVTKYYHEASFGDYIVTGDILINPLNPEAPFKHPSDGKIDVRKLLSDIWENKFQTKHQLPADSFDLWKKTPAGAPKLPRDLADPLQFDHIMIICRNCTYPGNLAGYASAGNISANGPVKTDSYSLFATRSAIPIHILLHEYNHLLLGGNNKHCCGGNHAASGPQLFLAFQGGWGMMGAANKSLMTCNAWDRYKLGWKLPQKQHFISALDQSLNEINTDFNPHEWSLIDTLIVLRDFTLTGDAVRIKLPGIPDSEYQQWLWIENHQTQAFNNSPFDVFQYQHAGCAGKAIPGLYLFIQVAHEDLSGKNAFGDYADFIKPLPASGMYDFIWGDTMVRNNWCVGNGLFYPFERSPKLQNPLTGNSVLELIPFDNNADGHISEKEKREPAIEIISGELVNNLPYLGEAGMAFSLLGNRKISIGTNPSTSNALTLLNDEKLINKGLAPDNRCIYLNNISIEILGSASAIEGALLIRIRNNDNRISQNIRWCAPNIVLGDNLPGNDPELIVAAGKKLTIDAGFSPTRTDSSIQLNGQHLFTSFTSFQIRSGAKILLEPRSRLILKNHSQLTIMEGAEIILLKGAKIQVSDHSVLINNGKITRY